MLEHPPGSGTAEQVGRIVDHGGVAVTDTERADHAREGRGIGQHVRQGDRVIGDGVDVEARRAGHMAFLEQ